LNTTAIGNGVVATISATVASTATGTSAVQLTNLSEAISNGSAGSIAGVAGALTIANSAASTISVTPASATLSANQSVQFTATTTNMSNTGVTWSLSPVVGSMSSGTYTAPASIPSAQTVTVTATSAADSTKSASATITLTPAASSSISIWPSTATPSIPFYASSPLEIGVKFRSDVAGTITGIRFYKGQENTGVHTGSLWSVAGELLATGAFANETPSGWQTLTFATPVTIAANTTYVASYHSNTGLAIDLNYFQLHGVDNPPLHALQSGVDGPNGVFAYGPGGVFPNNAFAGHNYWVDVVMRR
jgi:hypothetical protein